MHLDNWFDLQGKIALVTGSTHGIGREIARGLVAAGAYVWVHGRNVDEGIQLARELSGKFVQADLAQEAEVQRLAQTIITSEQHLDVLINNAGLEITTPIEQMQLDKLDLV